jgi:hypothetical protein
MHAALLTYSRSRGVFAGVNLKGVVINPDDELNLAVYGKTAEELLKEPADGSDGTESDLSAFPRALIDTRPGHDVHGFRPSAARGLLARRCHALAGDLGGRRPDDSARRRHWSEDEEAAQRARLRR